MKCIFYDGRIEGAAQAAKAARESLPGGAKVVTRDASSWLQRPDGTEKFSGVLIPAGAEFDPLAEAYAAVKADVERGEPAAPSEQKPKGGKAAKKE